MSDEGAVTYSAVHGDPRAVHARDQCDEITWEAMGDAAQAQLAGRAEVGRVPGAANYLAHLHELAEETGALLTLIGLARRRGGWRARTIRTTHWVELQTPAPLTCDLYLLGLHEFGHVKQPDLGGECHERAPTGEGLYGELMAWVWAFEHARAPMTQRDLLRVQETLYTTVLDIACEQIERCSGRDDVKAVLDVMCVFSKHWGREFVPAHLRDAYHEGIARLETLLADDPDVDVGDPVEAEGIARVEALLADEGRD